MTAPEIVIRPLPPDEIGRLADLDRSEEVRLGYRMDGAGVVSMPVEWNIPRFRREGDGDHSLAAQIGFCRGHLERPV